jgi:hypothetical protein
VNPFGDFIILKPKEKQNKKMPTRPSRGSRWPEMDLSAVALLSFSQAISLSLLNDKKKEEEEEGDERLSAAGRRSGREEKNRRRKK